MRTWKDSVLCLNKMTHKKQNTMLVTLFLKVKIHVHLKEFTSLNMLGSLLCIGVIVLMIIEVTGQIL